MTVATADLPIIRRSPEISAVCQVKMKGSTTLYQGTIAMLNASGYLVTGADTASQTGGYVVRETKTNSGADGATTILCDMHGIYWFAHTGLGVTDIGAQATISDNATVSNAATTTNDVKMGKILEIETIGGVAGAWVEVGAATIA